MSAMASIGLSGVLLNGITGPYQRCECGIVVQRGLLVGACEICNDLVANPKILGVEAVSARQIFHRTTGTGDDRQLEFSFFDSSQLAILTSKTSSG